MARIKANGELSGGVTFVYATQTISGHARMTLPTGSVKAKGIIAVSSNYVEVFYATDDMTHPFVDGTEASAYTMTFSNGSVDFGREYAGADTTFKYYYWY